MNIAICDDELFFREQLCKLTMSYFKNNKLEIPRIFLFSSAEKLTKEQMVYDIAFLDVDMPGRSGLTAIPILRDWNPRIIPIIITGFSDTFLDESFACNAFRYMTKPLNEVRFKNNLKAALQHYIANDCILHIETDKGLLTVPAEKIIMIDTVKRKTIAILEDQTLVTSYKISDWVSLLPEPCFIAINKGNIINFKHVAMIYKEEVAMFGIDRHLYMARRRAPEIKKKYLFYIENNT